MEAGLKISPRDYCNFNTVVSSSLSKILLSVNRELVFTYRVVIIIIHSTLIQIYRFM